MGEIWTTRCNILRKMASDLDTIKQTNKQINATQTIMACELLSFAEINVSKSIRSDQILQFCCENIQKSTSHHACLGFPL